MTLQTPGYNVLPVSPSSLNGLLENFDKGLSNRRDEDALMALARAGQGQTAPVVPGAPMAAPQDALSRLISGSHTATTGAVRPELAAALETGGYGTPVPAVPAGYLANARAAESGGNDAAANPNSSARGRYQFLEGTWNGLAKQYPELGLTPEGRTDPAQQERAMEVFTRDNAAALAAKGLAVNPGSLYAAHFLGAGGASSVLGQDPASPLSAYVSPEVIQSNPHLQGMTVGDFVNWTNSKGGGGSSSGYTPPRPDEGAVQGAKPYTFDPETMGALLMSDKTRPLALSLIEAQKGADASQGRMAVEEWPDGSLVQRDTLTGEVNILREPPAAASSGERPLTPEERAQWGIPETDTRPYSIAPGKAPEPVGGSGGQTINVNTGGDSALDGALSKAEGEDWATFKEAATTSASNAQDFEILGELLTLAPQGPITGRLADTFKGFSAAGDAANSIIKRIAPTLRAPGSGATSDIEYNGMLQSLPSLAQMPEANAMVLSIMQAKAQINMERGRIISEYQSGGLTVDEARRAMDELNSKSIMTPDMKRALLGIGSDGAVGVEPPAVGEEVDGYIYQGGDPASPTSWTQVN